MHPTDLMFTGMEGERLTVGSFVRKDHGYYGVVIHVDPRATGSSHLIPVEVLWENGAQGWMYGNALRSWKPKGRSGTDGCYR